jgi:hypothetical protein
MAVFVRIRISGGKLIVSQPVEGVITLNLALLYIKSKFPTLNLNRFNLD